MRFLLVLLTLTFLFFKSSEAANFACTVNPGESKNFQLSEDEPPIFEFRVGVENQPYDGYFCKVELCPSPNESGQFSGMTKWPHYRIPGADFVIERFNTETSSWEVIDDDEGIYSYPMAYIRVGGNYTKDRYRFRRYSGNGWIFLNLVVTVYR
jgi:hypothetical protein